MSPLNGLPSKAVSVVLPTVQHRFSIFPATATLRGVLAGHAVQTLSAHRLKCDPDSPDTILRHTRALASPIHVSAPLSVRVSDTILTFKGGSAY